jgi:Flp pilus assembly protein TadG
MNSKTSSKFVSWLRRSRAEEGQAMVMAAFSLIVILGFAAFAIDIGHVAVQKSDLQNAADAAALAGVVEIPSKENAEAKAVEYAKTNGMAVQTNKVTLNDELVSATATVASKQLRVECSRKVDYYFAGVLGFKSTVITAVAVAEIKNGWDGEVLPFLNADKTFIKAGTKVEAWEKVDSGYFECIDNFTIENNKAPYTNLYFNVNIDEGLQIKNGTVANKKQEIGHYYDTHKSSLTPKPYVFIFSLSPSAIASNKVNLMDGTTCNISSVKNKSSFVALSSLVLVKCTFDSYDLKKKTLYLTSVQVYDLGNNDPSNPYTDYPSDYVSPDGGTGARLIL